MFSINFQRLLKFCPISYDSTEFFQFKFYCQVVKPSGGVLGKPWMAVYMDRRVQLDLMLCVGMLNAVHNMELGNTESENIQV